jgi:hypothetical protein
MLQSQIYRNDSKQGRKKEKDKKQVPFTMKLKQIKPEACLMLLSPESCFFFYYYLLSVHCL